MRLHLYYDIITPKFPILSILTNFMKFYETLQKFLRSQKKQKKQKNKNKMSKTINDEDNESAEGDESLLLEDKETKEMIQTKEFKLELTSEDDFGEEQTIADWTPVIPAMTEEEKNENQKRIENIDNSTFLTVDAIPSWKNDGPIVVNENPPASFKPIFSANNEINEKVSFLLRGDVSHLIVDAAVIPGDIGHSRSQTGRCVVEKSSTFPTKYLIKVFGPIGLDRVKLEESYVSILKCIDGVNIRSVAVGCLSSGLYGYPIQTSCDTALSTVRKFLEVKENRDKVDRIIFAIHKKSDASVYSKSRHVFFPLDIKYTFREEEAAEEIKVQSDGNIVIFDKHDLENDISTDTEEQNVEGRTLPAVPSVSRIPPPPSESENRVEKHVVFGNAK